VIVHAAGCDTQDSLMLGGLCDKLHGRPSQLLLALQQSSIDNQILADNRDFCLPTCIDAPVKGVTVTVRIVP